METVVTFTPEDDYRAAVDRIVQAVADLEPPLPEQCLEDLRLVVTEACSNAVKVHRDDADEPVVVTCELDDDHVSVEVRDRGPGFDPDELEPLPEPTDPRRLRYEHGLGVPLIRQLADEVRFRQASDGTIVSMTIGRPEGATGQSIQ